MEANYEIKELLQKSFQLASFIVHDRPTAIRVVMDAFNKLEVQHNREQKRVYWRDKHLKGKVTRIARQNIDALQWLIYFESEAFERYQEQSGCRRARTMIVSYIKHLIQICTPMSAFYVNVGLHRLLHNYSTSEVQQAYERVTARYPGSQEYRRVKGSLMSQLQDRFGNMVQTVRGQHGELRFEIMEDQDYYLPLINDCLRQFTPWSTRKTLDLSTMDHRGKDDPFEFLDRHGMDPDKIETCRCHVFIDPDWFALITRELKLDAPQHRLSLPKFFLDTDSSNQDTSGGVNMPAPELTDHEQNSIFGYLSAEAKRRKSQPRAKVLKIVSHGTEYARLGAEDSEPLYCELPEGAKLIEIWIEQDGGDLLIATYWLNYTEWHGIAADRTTIDLGNHREIEVVITPMVDRAGSASLALSCRPASNWLQRFWRMGRAKLAPRPSVLRFAFGAVSLVAIGWVVGSSIARREMNRQQATAEGLGRALAHEKALRESLQQQLSQRGPAPMDIYRLTPDEVQVRTNERSRRPVVHLNPNQALVTIQLPVAAAKNQKYRAVLTEFLKHQEILSEVFPAVTQNSTGSAIEFQLPSSLVHDGQYYVITVSYWNDRGPAEPYRSFTFLVSK